MKTGLRVGIPISAIVAVVVVLVAGSVRRPPQSVERSAHPASALPEPGTPNIAARETGPGEAAVPGALGKQEAPAPTSPEPPAAARPFQASGEVLDTAGHPVENALVILRQGQAGLGSFFTPSDRARTDAWGRFVVGAEKGGVCGLYVVKEHHRLVRRWPTLVRGDNPIPGIVLAAGEEISGRVLHGDEPFCGATVRLTLWRLGSWVSRDGPDVPESRRVVDCVSDARGHWIFDGLEPTGSYSIEIAKLSRSDVHPDLRHVGHRNLTPPRHGLDLAMHPSHLAFRVFGGGRPIPGATASFSGQTLFVSDPTGADGRCRVAVMPERRFDVRIVAPGRESRWVKLVSPRVGEERVEEVDLPPLRPRPSLLLTVDVPADSEPVLWAMVDLEPVGGGTSFSGARRAGADGRLLFPRVPPGRHRLRVQPARDFTTEYYLTAVETLVVLPEEGQAEARVMATIGGRLRIAARDETGKALRARCQVSDVDGNRLDVRFQSPVGNLSYDRERLHRGAPTPVDPALPPGRYWIDLSYEGRVARRVPADVAAGVTTDVEVRLRRAD